MLLPVGHELPVPGRADGRHSRRKMFLAQATRSWRAAYCWLSATEVSWRLANHRVTASVVHPEDHRCVDSKRNGEVCVNHQET